MALRICLLLLLGQHAGLGVGYLDRIQQPDGRAVRLPPWHLGAFAEKVFPPSSSAHHCISLSLKALRL